MIWVSKGYHMSCSLCTSIFLISIMKCESRVQFQYGLYMPFKRCLVVKANHTTKRMTVLQRQLRLVLTLLCCVHFHVQSSLEVEDGVNRSQFPEGFLFGTSSSSYQVLVYFCFLCFQTPWS